MGKRKVYARLMHAQHHYGYRAIGTKLKGELLDVAAVCNYVTQVPKSKSRRSYVKRAAGLERAVAIVGNAQIMPDSLRKRTAPNLNQTASV